MVHKERGKGDIAEAYGKRAQVDNTTAYSSGGDLVAGPANPDLSRPWGGICLILKSIYVFSLDVCTKLCVLVSVTAFV